MNISKIARIAALPLAGLAVLAVSVPSDAASTGTFAVVSESHTAQGSGDDIATLVVKNTGTGTITNITRTCTNQSWHVYGNPPTSIAPGAQATFLCQAGGSGSYIVNMTLTGTNASNSPFSVSF